MIRRFLNGETRLSIPQSPYTESIGVRREPGELKHLSSRMHPIPVNLFRGVDNDFFDKLIDHWSSQFRKIGVLLRQRKKLRRTVEAFFLKIIYVILSLIDG